MLFNLWSWLTTSDNKTLFRLSTLKVFKAYWDEFN